MSIYNKDLLHKFSSHIYTLFSPCWDASTLSSIRCRSLALYSNIGIPSSSPFAAPTTAVALSTPTASELSVRLIVSGLAVNLFLPVWTRARCPLQGTVTTGLQPLLPPSNRLNTQANASLCGITDMARLAARSARLAHAIPSGS